MSFLKAEWRKLAIANFVVNESVLNKYLPKGTELDLWEGKCYVSLVSFKFVNTKIIGIKIPYHINFEEVNLRFYVKRKVNEEWRRGVVFIKEIVPRSAITFVANTLYKENYETMSMKHLWEEETDCRHVMYSWKKENEWQTFKVTADLVSKEIELGSETEFITEHYWGYAKVSDLKTNEYEVTHPKWRNYPVKEFTIKVDFGKTYGEEFSFLNDLEPVSVMLAEGSEITVESKKTLNKF